MIFRFNENHCFMVLTKKLIISVLSEWVNFVLAKKLCFVRKISCVVLPKKLGYVVLLKIFIICNFGRKQFFFCFSEKIILRFGRVTRFMISADFFFLTICKNSFLQFCRENSFWRKLVFRFP